MGLQNEGEIVMQTLAERLTLENRIILKKLEETNRRLSRCFIEDMMKTVKSGEVYRRERHTSKETKRRIKELKQLAKIKRRLDF